MCKLISFGGYNKLYKYIWIYLIFGLILNQSSLILRKEIIDFPQDIIIQQIFDYLGVFIFSLLLYIYFYWKKEEKDDKRNISEINISRTKSSSSYINLIYNKYDENRPFSIKQYFILVILLILSNQLEHIFYNIGLDGLNFWMFGIVFISIIYSKIFKIGIYLHHKIAIGFISIFYGPLMFFYNFLLNFLIFCIFYSKKVKKIYPI